MVFTVPPAKLFAQPHQKLFGLDKLFLYRLIQLYGHPFTIAKSTAHLAAEVGLSLRQVTKSISVLVEGGMLKSEADFEQRRGGRRVISTTGELDDLLIQLRELDVSNIKLVEKVLKGITTEAPASAAIGGGELLSLSSIGSRGQILLAALVALSNEEGLVKGVAFTCLMDISGLKRTGVQGVIRKLKAQRIISFYQPGRLAVAVVTAYSDGRRRAVKSRVATTGFILLDMTRLGCSEKFTTFCRSSPIKDDIARLKQLAVVFQIPGLTSELRKSLGERFGVNAEVYGAMSAHKAVLGAYLENKAVLQSLISAVYLSINFYLAKNEKCPLGVLQAIRDGCDDSEPFDSLEESWKEFGFLKDSNPLSMYLLKKYSLITLADIHQQLASALPLCQCLDREVCMSVRICPMQPLGADYMLFVRTLTMNADGVG